MCARREVADFMWPRHLGGPRTPVQVAEMLRVDAAHWTAKGFGMWILRDRTDGRVLGEAGLQYTVVAGSAEVEVGWFLHPEAWGRGYATEVTRAALAHAPAIRGLRSVVAFTMVENERARATIERCGFELEGDTTVVDLPHVLYRWSVAA